MIDIECLQQARELVKRGWCQHALAIDENGDQTTPESANTVAWCPRGALYAQYPKATRAVIISCAVRFLEAAGPYLSIERWNDQKWRTKKQVLLAFSRAIEQIRE